MRRLWPARGQRALFVAGALLPVLVWGVLLAGLSVAGDGARPERVSPPGPSAGSAVCDVVAGPAHTVCSRGRR